jgi:hypothetical protein
MRFDTTIDYWIIVLRPSIASADDDGCSNWDRSRHVAIIPWSFALFFDPLGRPLPRIIAGANIIGRTWTAIEDVPISRCLYYQNGCISSSKIYPGLANRFSTIWKHGRPIDFSILHVHKPRLPCSFALWSFAHSAKIRNSARSYTRLWTTWKYAPFRQC